MDGSSPEQIEDASLRHELENRYLAYALSTIISRSLPDVRDGLKPVHRRILFAMRALRLDPGTPFKKSARVVGDVIGKFHPHGDQAAYDAMVRLAQEFAVRYPLVDGQGNFGNVDGDGPAAMRYTEARLTKVALALLEDLDRNTVPHSPTYDGSQEEPQVLPARFPNLLANGASGIAVGMATSIPPHNVGEIIDACLHLIQHPDATTRDLLRFLPGPDFPTGGQLLASAATLQEIYESGRGSLKLRCRWEKANLPRGAWHIVITEIPYQVPKSRLLERIGQMILTRKCPFLEDVRDESDERIRIVLEPKSSRLEAERIMAYLFRNSDLEVRVTVNMNVVTAATRPEVMGLRALLQAWLDHRFQVHTRRARHELAEIQARLHLLAAHLIVHLNIDEVVAIIKEHDEPAPVLMSRFSLDRDQANAILDMRLRNLRKLEEIQIKKEMAEKEARAAELNAQLADSELMWKSIRKELERTRKEFADPRRTDIVEDEETVEWRPEDLVEKEPLTVILSQKGWVKSIKGHGIDAAKIRFKEGDEIFTSLETYSTCHLTFLTPRGKVYSILAGNLPAGKGFGEAWTVLFETDGGEMPSHLISVQTDREYFVSTQEGQGFRVKGGDLVANIRRGKQVLVVKPGDAPLHVLPVQGPWLAAISSESRLLVCPVSQFPVLARGQGVRIQRFRRGELQVDVTTFSEESGLILESNRERVRQFTMEQLAPWSGNRADKGAVLPHGFMGGAVFQGTGAVWKKANKVPALFEE